MSSELRAGPNGAYSYAQMEFCGHSWNADGTQFAFGIRFNNLPEYYQEIWVVDTALGTSSLLVSGNGVGWPEWSPDGSRIGYVSSGGTVVYTLATGNTKRLSSNARESWGRTIWSPSGAHFAIYHWSNNLSGYDAIYRFTADVGGKTNLTQGMETPQYNVFLPVGWRN
jgi:Tol biopolymer transport system component